MRLKDYDDRPETIDPALIEQRKRLLTPEQLSVVEGWERDKIRSREAFLKYLDSAHTDADIAEFEANCRNDFCAHERSIWSHCIACEEIEQILYPENYEDDL